MSILIKGMAMPKNCEDCPMCHSTAEYDYAYCCVSSAETSGNKIPSDCPLVPVPPHGRLIDADALRLLYDFKNYKPTMTEEEFDRLMCTLPVIRANIDDAPTIIESEG